MSAGDLILLLESSSSSSSRCAAGPASSPRTMRRSLAPRSAAAAAAAAAPAVARAAQVEPRGVVRPRARAARRQGQRREHAADARAPGARQAVAVARLARVGVSRAVPIGLPTLAGAAFALLHWGLGGSTVTARTRHHAAASSKPALWLFVLYAERLLQARTARPPARPVARPPARPAALFASDTSRPAYSAHSSRSRAAHALLNHHTLPQRVRRHRVPRATPR